MDLKALLKEIDQLVTPTIESMGYELVESEYLNEHGRWILRLYIDSEGGPVGLGDCEKVSRAVESLLDVEDIVPGSYNLEVSSPGIERPVRKEKDFRKYEGFNIKLRTREKIDGRRNFNGILRGMAGDRIKIDEAGCIVEIPIDKVMKARLRQDVVIGGKEND